MTRFLAALAVLAGVLAAQSSLPSAGPRSAGFAEDRLALVDQLVEGAVAGKQVAGAQFLVLRDAEVAAWQCHGLRDVDSGAPMTRDTIFRIYSMTKPVTAVAALQLLERGELRLDSPIGQWLPALADPQVLTGGTAEAPQLVPAARPITVRMLLNHTSGLTYDFFRDSPVQELYRRADLWGSASLDEFLAKVARLPLLSQPGEEYHYGIGLDVLGALIEKVAGRPLEEHLQANLFVPLGMPDTSFDVPPEKQSRLAALHVREQGALRTQPPTFGVHAEAGKGFSAGGAGLFSTIGDYGRFARMLLRGGELDGERVLARKTMELAVKNTLPRGQDVGPDGDGWGLFSAVRFDQAASGELGGEGLLYWSGAATTHFFVDPKENLVGLLFCQHLPYDQPGLIGRFRTAVYRALE